MKVYFFFKKISLSIGLLFILFTGVGCPPIKNSNNKIELFKLNSEELEINHSKGVIKGQLPDDSDVRVEIELSDPHATLYPSPESGRVNYSYPVVFTVTAENGAQRFYLFEIEYTTTPPAPEEIPVPFNIQLNSYSGESVIRAEDLVKSDLFQLTGVPDGTWDYRVDATLPGDNTPLLTFAGDFTTLDGNTSFSLQEPQNWKVVPDGEIELLITLFQPGYRGEKSYTTEKQQYSLYSWRDLQNIFYDLNGDYTLMDNITLPEPGVGGYSFWGFTPIGTEWFPFTGSFDGQSHTISNLYINLRNNKGVGLFSFLNQLDTSKPFIVKDLSIELREVDFFRRTSIYGRGHVGGLAGFLGAGVVENVAVVGGVIKSNIVESMTGGLIGRNGVGREGSGLITGCYTDTELSGEDYLGGLVGDNQGSIANSYSLSTINGNNNSGSMGRFGGLVGRNGDFSYPGYIEFSYAAGSVVGGHNLSGGLVGLNSNSSQVADSYYDSETTEMSDNTGKGEPKVSEEMKREATFLGWDFTDIWSLDVTGTINEGYPYLQELLPLTSP